MQFNPENTSSLNEEIEETNIEIEIEEDIDIEMSNIQIGDEVDQSLEDEKSSRFKDGDLLNMIRVRFPGNAKSFPFFIGKRRFSYGQKVVAMSDRGMTVGYINSFPYEVTFNKSMLPIRSIAKVASEEDIKAQKDFRDSEKKAEVVCLHLIEKHKLDMVLTHVEFIQFGKKAVFYFNAPERVDFRELVKDLVGDLKMRIELRQISVRDRAAALGAIGACGLQTCCSSFLKAYGNVSIKMAKNQNLALIPSKLNGVCGQIKCCIKYEDDVYADKRKNLPKEGTFIKAKNGDIGKVLRLHLLVEQFELLTDFGAKRRYAVSEFDEKIGLPENYKFPETFDHIVDETKEVIGLTLEEKLKAERFVETHPDEEELEELDDYEGDDFDDQDPDDVNPYENDVEVNAIVTEAKATYDEAKQITEQSKNHNREQNRDARPNNNRDQRPNNNNNRNQNQNNRNRPNPNGRNDGPNKGNANRDNRTENRHDNRNNNRPNTNPNRPNPNQRPNENRNNENRTDSRSAAGTNTDRRPPNNNRPQGNNNNNNHGQNRNKNFKPRNNHHNPNRDQKNPNPGQNVNQTNKKTE